MEKQKERDGHSNTNCETWTKSVMLKGRRSLKPQWPSVVTRGTDIAIGQVLSAHQRVFGSSLRLPGSLLSDDPIDRQLLTADPYRNFHRANEMRTAAQRALFKQKFCTCGASRRIGTSQISTERKHQCRRTRPWCGAATSSLEEKFGLDQVSSSQWHQREHPSGISMRGCLLKCSSEQVRKATGAEWLGAELSKNSGDGNAEEPSEKRTTWVRRCGYRRTTN